MNPSHSITAACKHCIVWSKHISTHGRMCQPTRRCNQCRTLCTIQAWRRRWWPASQAAGLIKAPAHVQCSQAHRCQQQAATPATHVTSYTASPTVGPGRYSPHVAPSAVAELSGHAAQTTASAVPVLIRPVLQTAGEQARHEQCHVATSGADDAADSACSGCRIFKGTVKRSAALPSCSFQAMRHLTNYRHGRMALGAGGPWALLTARRSVSSRRVIGARRADHGLSGASVDVAGVAD
jgi:hypothetical protein